MDANHAVTRNMRSPSRDASKMDPGLAAYGRFYALLQVFYTLFYAQRGEYMQFPIHALLAVWPTRGLVVASHFAYALLRLYRMPFLFNSDVWAAILDASFAMAVLKTRSLAVGSTIVRRQLAAFYFGAALWKINSSFLSPRTSCSSIVMIALVDRFATKAPGALFAVVARAAPYLTILVEFSVGVLLLVAVKWGVVLGLVFHLAIALTPCPNCAGPFCVMLATRFFLCVTGTDPAAAVQALQEPRTVSFAVGCAAVLGKLCTPNGKNIFFVDVSIPFYTFQTIILARTLMVSWRRNQQKPIIMDRPLFGRGLVLWAYFYSFGLVIFGLGDMATTHMYSNLRVHGVGNHYFLPTGLLFRYFESASPRTNPFAGGTVRVDATNSSFVQALYPQEWTHLHTASVTKKLHKAGHIGRQFFPLKSRIFGGRHAGGRPNVPYTVPALEFRRLLAEARDHQDHFEIIYARLSGPVDGHSSLSETWPVVRYTSSDDACVVLKAPNASSVPCDTDELVFLPPPNPLLLKVALFYPIPLIHGESSSEMLCADP